MYEMIDARVSMVLIVAGSIMANRVSLPGFDALSPASAGKGVQIKTFLLFIGLLFAWNTAGCVTTSSITDKKHRTPKHYEVWTSKKYQAGVGPVQITDQFLIGDGNTVYVIAKFMDLTAHSKYRFKFEWYDPNGKMYGSKSVMQKVSDANWFTGNYLKLDRKYQESYTSGLWSVKVYADDTYIDERKFFIAHDSTELKHIVALEKTRDRTAIEKPELNPVVSDYWAVVIGISEYRYSGQNGLENLAFADDDARAFADLLADLGWRDSHITLLVNEAATKRNITVAIESWLTKANPNDRIVLFWAGHGYPDPEDPEKVYFACHDSDLSVPVTGYRMDLVRSALEERKSKNVIVFADTCHAGKFITRGERGLSIIPHIDHMRRNHNIPKGWIFMVGADSDRKAIEHTSWTNGAFTHCLIQGLSGKADGFQSVAPVDGTVTMGEMRAYMNTAMPDETQKVLGIAKRPVITTGTGDPDIWNLTLQLK